MNCLEFRRRCVAEPGSQDAELLRHKRGCPRCAEFMANIAQFDKRVTEALYVAAPSNLASRIILRQSLYARQARRRRVYALVASVLLVAGLSIGVMVNTRTPPVERAVLARINAVPESLLAKQQIPSTELVRVLRTLGGELNRDLGKVNYASIYYVRNHECGHLVITGAQGPVTVLLMPGVYSDGRQSLQTARFNGVIVPTANGSMAIVGEKGEALAEIEQRMRSAITWRL